MTSANISQQKHRPGPQTSTKRHPPSAVDEHPGCYPRAAALLSISQIVILLSLKGILWLAITSSEFQFLEDHGHNFARVVQQLLLSNEFPSDFAHGGFTEGPEQTPLRDSGGVVVSEQPQQLSILRRGLATVGRSVSLSNNSLPPESEHHQDHEDRGSVLATHDLSLEDRRIGIGSAAAGGAQTPLNSELGKPGRRFGMTALDSPPGQEVEPTGATSRRPSSSGATHPRAAGGTHPPPPSCRAGEGKEMRWPSEGDAMTRQHKSDTTQHCGRATAASGSAAAAALPPMPDVERAGAVNTAKVDTRSPVSGRLTLTPPNESLAISPAVSGGVSPESAGLRSADTFSNNSSEKYALTCYFLFAASYQYAAAILLLCYFVRSGSSVEGKTLSAGSVGDPVEYGGAEMRKRNEPARDLHDASTEARRPRRCFGLFRGFSEDARGRSRTKKKGAKVGSGARNRGGRGIVQAAAMGARVESCKADFPTARASSDKYHAAASNRRVPKRQKSEPRQSPAKAVDHFRGDREFAGGSLTVGAGNQPSVGAGNFVEWSSTKFPDQTDQLGGESSPRIRQSDQSDRGYNIDASVLSTYGGGYDFQTKVNQNQNQRPPRNPRNSGPRQSPTKQKGEAGFSQSRDQNYGTQNFNQNYGTLPPTSLADGGGSYQRGSRGQLQLPDCTGHAAQPRSNSAAPRFYLNKPHQSTENFLGAVADQHDEKEQKVGKEQHSSSRPQHLHGNKDNCCVEHFFLGVHASQLFCLWITIFTFSVAGFGATQLASDLQLSHQIYNHQLHHNLRRQLLLSETVLRLRDPVAGRPNASMLTLEEQSAGREAVALCLQELRRSSQLLFDQLQFDASGHLRDCSTQGNADRQGASPTAGGGDSNHNRDHTQLELSGSSSRLLLSAAGTTASSSSKPVGGGPYRSSFFPLGNPMVSRANSENVVPPQLQAHSISNPGLATSTSGFMNIPSSLEGAADCHHQQLLSASGEGLGLRDSQTSLGRPGAPPASPRGAASLSAEQFASSGYMKSAGDHGGAGEVEVEGQADAYALREAAGEEEEGGGGTSTTNSRALVCSAAREEVAAFPGPIIPASRGGEAGDLDRTTPISCEYLLTQQKILADAAAQLIERFEGMRAAREEGLTSEKVGGFRQNHLLLRQASKGSAAGFSSASAADGPFYFAGGGTTTSSMPFLLRGSQQEQPAVNRNLLHTDDHTAFRSWFLFLLWPIYVFATVFALPCHLWWRGLKEKRRIDQQGIFDERNPPSHWADEVEARQHCSAEINKAPRSNPGQTTSPPLVDQGSCANAYAVPGSSSRRDCAITSRVNGREKPTNGESQMLTLANYRKQKKKNSIVNSNSSARERGDPLQHFNQRSSCSQMDMSVVENLAQPVMMAMSSYVGGAPRQRDYSTKRSGSGVGTMMHRDDNRSTTVRASSRKPSAGEPLLVQGSGERESRESGIPNQGHQIATYSRAASSSHVGRGPSPTAALGYPPSAGPASSTNAAVDPNVPPNMVVARGGAAGAYLDSPMILNSLLHSVSERVAGAISEFFEDNADKRKIYAVGGPEDGKTTCHRCPCHSIKRRELKRRRREEKRRQMEMEQGLVGAGSEISMEPPRYHTNYGSMAAGQHGSYDGSQTTNGATHLPPGGYQGGDLSFSYELPPTRPGGDADEHELLRQQRRRDRQRSSRNRSKRLVEHREHSFIDEAGAPGPQRVHDDKLWSSGPAAVEQQCRREDESVAPGSFAEEPRRHQRNVQMNDSLLAPEDGDQKLLQTATATNPNRHRSGTDGSRRHRREKGDESQNLPKPEGAAPLLQHDHNTSTTSRHHSAGTNRSLNFENQNFDSDTCRTNLDFRNCSGDISRAGGSCGDQGNTRGSIQELLDNSRLNNSRLNRTGGREGVPGGGTAGGGSSSTSFLQLAGDVGGRGNNPYNEQNSNTGTHRNQSSAGQETPKFHMGLNSGAAQAASQISNPNPNPQINPKINRRSQDSVSSTSFSAFWTAFLSPTNAGSTSGTNRDGRGESEGVSPGEKAGASRGGGETSNFPSASELQLVIHEDEALDCDALECQNPAVTAAAAENSQLIEARRGDRGGHLHVRQEKSDLGGSTKTTLRRSRSAGPGSQSSASNTAPGLIGSRGLVLPDAMRLLDSTRGKLRENTSASRDGLQPGTATVPGAGRCPDEAEGEGIICHLEDLEKI